VGKTKATGPDEKILEKIEDTEFYIDEKGRLGAVLPYFAPDHVRSLSDWSRDEGKELGEVLISKIENVFWPLCGEPPLKDDPALFGDVERFIRDHVYFTDDAHYSVAASWAICTWMSEALQIAPRLIFYGTTQSGKSRAINTLNEIVYRGHASFIPTSAVLYATIERCNITPFIDEYQAIQNVEKLTDVEAVFKAGYEKGGTVLRMNRDTMEPVIHHVYGFMGLGTKGKLPPEDLVNRAIILNMQQKPRAAKIARRVDRERGIQLRGRLLAFRIRVRSGEIDISSCFVKATELALKPVEINGALTELGDRPIDLAESLLTPSLIFGAGKEREILKVVANSQAESIDELISTPEGRTFHALQFCYKSRPTTKVNDLNGQPLKDISRLTTLDIADQLNQDVNDQECRDTYTKRDRIETQYVTGWLKTLGFSFKRGSGNKSYFTEERFLQAYRTNLEKYGVRDGCPDIRKDQLTLGSDR
jgi:hypothetical protein